MLFLATFALIFATVGVAVPAGRRELTFLN